MTRLSHVHRALLERWRTAMNLVGPGPVDEHFDDCARGLADLAAEGRWADFGSGAGFPGLVLADLFPDLQVDLVESRVKRAVFLEKIVADADVGARVAVLRSRVEALPPGRYDGVVARAFAPPVDVLRLAAPTLVPGGRVVLFLQPDQPAGEGPGWDLERDHRYRLADGRVRRTVTLRRVA